MGQFDSQISNVRENPRRSSENEQIRILLERQGEQILADCQAEIRKHEFQADYDRTSIQKLNEVIESQRGEICRCHHSLLEAARLSLFLFNVHEQAKPLRQPLALCAVPAPADRSFLGRGIFGGSARGPRMHIIGSITTWLIKHSAADAA